MFATAACGGGAEEQPAPKVPPPPISDGEEAADPTWQTESKPEPTAEPESEPAERPARDCPEPEFKQGMSVNDAIAAVDTCWEFVGIEADILAKPLQDPETFKPCKLGPNHHFELRLAIWDGRVVGADVKSPNAKLASCVEKQVRELTYDAKSQAINTVEYKY